MQAVHYNESTNILAGVDFPDVRSIFIVRFVGHFGGYHSTRRRLDTSTFMGLLRADICLFFPLTPPDE